MRLSARLASALCVLSLALPIASHAAAPVAKALKLRDMMTIVNANKKPLSFDASISASSADGTLKATVKGTHNGKTSSTKNMVADMAITLDVTVKDMGAFGAKGRMILVKQNAYVILDAFTVTMDEDYEDYGYDPTVGYDAVFAEYGKKWIKIPLDEKALKELQVERHRNSSASLKEIEPYFTVVQKALKDRVTYTATIPASKQRRLLKLLAVDPGYAGVTDNLGEVLRNAKISANFSVDAVKGSLASFTMTLGLKAKVEGESVALNVRSTGKVLQKMPFVKAPAESMTLEELMEASMGSSDWEADASYTSEGGRDAQRKSDVNTILNALYQYEIDHDGALPKSVPVGQRLSICASGERCNGVSLDFLEGSYIVKLPNDPSMPLTTDVSGYMLYREASSDRITISAPLAEEDEVSVTR